MKSHAIRRFLAALVAAAGLALSGCSNDPSGAAATQVFTANFGDILGLGAPPAEDPQLAALTRASLDGIDTPLMLVDVPEINAQAVVFLAARNQGVRTYQTADDNTVLMDGPVLFRTQGIGPDLLSAETRQLRAMLARGQSGRLTRVLRHLDGLDQAVPISFDCTLRDLGAEGVVVLERQYATRHMRESCTAPDGLSVENDYWIGADGTAWQTRQWVSRRLGYLTTQQLIP